ncbi:hypothetical protein ETAA1_53070 [Urbifossiella limnaea]|uniref:Homeodomain phBC6A51-type domain-containing protein n=1 Tax=Urbifossiella limnaea TaxID=2528023 RepID=A0A517Y0M2_9BACT|nr:hypothetical protein ETAA1_53070 [Urbifossiella limnaea]
MAPARQEENGENGTELTERQEQVAAALAAGATVARVCRECRVGVQTVYTWKRSPAFNARVAALRRDLTERALGRLSDMMAGAALDRLQKLFRAKNEGVQLEAVKTVYELFLQVTSTVELRTRIEELEAARPKGKR